MVPGAIRHPNAAMVSPGSVGWFGDSLAKTVVLGRNEPRGQIYRGGDPAVGSAVIFKSQVVGVRAEQTRPQLGSDVLIAWSVISAALYHG